MKVVAEDRRVQRTRMALERAFTKLFFAHGYEAIKVGEVAREADVGRSTFYEHFTSKEDILWACMSRFFSVFAEAVSSEGPPARLVWVLEHFWENRKRADAVFSGAPRLIISRSLARLIEARLKEIIGRKRALAPLHLAAAQLAEAQLVLTDTWLRGKAACTPSALADAFHASSYASARALMFGLSAD